MSYGSILEDVPHDQLAIQWDTNFEFGMLEGVFPVWFDDVKGGILERLLRLSRHVPPDVQLGYHFCYGDVQHRHFTEPADAGKLVDVANALAASLGRPLNWIHSAGSARAPRRGVLRAATGASPAPRDRVLPRPDPSHRTASTGRVRPHGGSPAASCPTSASPRSAAGAGGPSTIPELLRIHRHALSAPIQRTRRPRQRFQWPARLPAVPDEDWTPQPVDTFGLRYDTVENHGWYREPRPDGGGSGAATSRTASS